MGIFTNDQTPATLISTNLIPQKLCNIENNKNSIVHLLKIFKDIQNYKLIIWVSVLGMVFYLNYFVALLLWGFIVRI